MNLRRATPDDAATIAGIHVETWRAAYRGLVPDSHLLRLDPGPQGAERFREFLESGEGETYVVERDGQPIGLLTVGPCRDDDLDESIGEIWGIYLAADQWRRGIGARVCARAEEMLRARGSRRIVLWVFEGNNRARRFYEAMGYSADGATKVIEVGAPLTAVRYGKDLPDGTPLPEPGRGPEVEET